MDKASSAFVGLGLAAGLALVLYLVAKKAGQTVAANAQLVNPLSRENVAAQAVEQTISAILGRAESFGTWFYGITSSETDPTKYTQAELERIVAARNRRANRELGIPEDWIVG